MTAEIDDRTVAYIVVAQTCFEDLKQVAGQLAGLLVLNAAGSRNAGPDHPMLALAERLHESASDALQGARATTQAARHHEYLLKASAILGKAVAAIRGRRDPLIYIEGAYAELRSASRCLPGFQMISFERGCCAPPPQK